MADSNWTNPAEIQARCRFVGLATAVVCLTTWAFAFRPFDDLLDGFGTPLGADFACFYGAARLTAQGRTAELYDPRAAERELHALFPTLAPHASLPFRYPPFVAGLVRPLAELSYVGAWLVFTAASVAAFAWAWRMLVRQTTFLEDRARRTAALALFVGWPVVWEVWLGGQWSMATLAIVCTVTELLARRRVAAAGAVLALAAFKPSATLFFAAGLVLRYPRMLVGAIPVGVALLAWSWSIVGGEGLMEYAALGSRLAAGDWDVAPDAKKFHDLLPLVSLVFGRGARPAPAVVGLVATCLAVAASRRNADAASSGDFRLFAQLLTINFLAGTYVPIYDLVLVGPSLLFAVEARRRRGPPCGGGELVGLQLVAAVLFFGPSASQEAFDRIHGQLFPAAWALTIAAATYALRRRERAANAAAER